MAYRWTSAHDWLRDMVSRYGRLDENDLLNMIEGHVDADIIQDYFQSDMDKEGYFDDDWEYDHLLGWHRKQEDESEDTDDMASVSS